MMAVEFPKRVFPSVFTSNVVWNKIHTLWQDKQNLTVKILLCFLALSLPRTVHCVCALFVIKPPPLAGIPAVKNNILLASTRELLQREHFFLSLSGVTWPTTMPLRSGLCKLSIIHLLMHSLLSQKNLYNCALTSNRWSSPQSFLRCSSQVIILKFGSNKIFHFFLRSTD